MRHAKTEPLADGMSDRQRELTARGRSDAQLVGRKLRAEGWVPDLILCSPAVRTRQTLERLLSALSASPDTRIVDDLYAGARDYLGTVAKCGGDARRLMVIGHNPTIHATARAAARTGDKSLRDRLSETFPTGAFARIAFAADDWAKATTQDGRLLSFVAPRDIGGGA
jgi:phosphohistidine phosphatase